MGSGQRGASAGGKPVVDSASRPDPDWLLRLPSIGLLERGRLAALVKRTNRAHGPLARRFTGRRRNDGEFKETAAIGAELLTKALPSLARSIEQEFADQSKLACVIEGVPWTGTALKHLGGLDLQVVLLAGALKLARAVCKVELAPGPWHRPYYRRGSVTPPDTLLDQITSPSFRTIGNYLPGDGDGCHLQPNIIGFLIAGRMPGLMQTRRALTFDLISAVNFWDHLGDAERDLIEKVQCDQRKLSAAGKQIDKLTPTTIVRKSHEGVAFSFDARATATPFDQCGVAIASVVDELLIKNAHRGCSVDVSAGTLVFIKNQRCLHRVRFEHRVNTVLHGAVTAASDFPITMICARYNEATP